MDKLISNTDFGFYVRELDINDHKKLELRENYDLFLKQPLTLGMFIPCDMDGNVLKEPERRCGLVGYDEQHYDFDDDELREYQEAKDRVLFKGLTIDSIFDSHWYFLNDNNDLVGAERSKSVEYLVGLDLILTESAKKQILGL